ncbi:MAG: hypothetical protein ABSC55_12785 [Syntrophorhabdales bacterium]|jgi:hypothetical protein
MAKKSNFLTLYHFTSTHHLEHWPILQQGLVGTDVPIAIDRPGPLAAVWLTSNPNPANQGWKDGSTVDKTEVRFTLRFRLPTFSLKKWSIYASEQKVSREWYATLDKTGGGGSDNWWLFFGHVPAEDFVSIEVRQGHKYLPLGDIMADLNNPLTKALANRDPVHLLKSAVDRPPMR